MVGGGAAIACVKAVRCEARTVLARGAQFDAAHVGKAAWERVNEAEPAAGRHGLRGVKSG
jgi:hypothetical protein